MKVAVPKEIREGEKRVALIPESVKRLSSKGIKVTVESGAGSGAWFSDNEYLGAGAVIEPETKPLFEQANIILKIHGPTSEEIEFIQPNTVVISQLFPQANTELVKRLAAKHITAVAVDHIPRTTIAQVMDVLSSQSTVAGYRAVILAAAALPKFFPMLMTPSGTMTPARVFIIGAGVAGLQAIATAKRLGAVVEAFDVRQVVKEQIESLGAKFVNASLTEDAETKGGYAREISAESKQRASSVIAERLAWSDVCITSALIPWKPAPKLITEEMVKEMRPGSVIVDLAAEQGGNCELTKPGEDIMTYGVTIIGRLNLPSDLAIHACQMYSRNMEKLLLHLVRDGALHLNFDDEIIRGCVISHAGKIMGGHE